MLLINSVRVNYVQFHGLDVSQCQEPSDTTVFHNKLFGNVHVILSQAGKPVIVFQIKAGKNEILRDLEGEFDLSLTHINSDNRECGGHKAYLTITKQDKYLHENS